MKKALSILLCLVMALSLLPTIAFAESDEREVISLVRATSDYTTPEYGTAMQKISFTVTEGGAAHFSNSDFSWRVDGAQVTGIFGENTYYYEVQLRIDGANGELYRLDDSVRVYVDGVEWNAGSCTIFSDYSYVWVRSPATSIIAPEMPSMSIFPVMPQFSQDLLKVTLTR